MTEVATTNELSYDDAVKEFLSYIRDYRSFSGLTVRAYGTDMRMLRAFLEKRLGRVPSEITREMIVQFGVSLRKPAPLTLRRKYACISSFFGFLQDMGYAQANPARRLPLPRVSEYVPVYLSEEMAQKLIAAADTPWTKAAVVLLLSTGIRRSEAVTITLDDLNLEERQLLIRGKGDKERVVPLTDQVVEAIQAYLPHRTKTPRCPITHRRGPEGMSAGSSMGWWSVEDAIRPCRQGCTRRPEALTARLSAPVGSVPRRRRRTSACSADYAALR